MGDGHSVRSVHPQAVVAQINLSHLQSNLQLARQLAPQSSVMAVIKGNAYGHGLLEVLPALDEADAFAVARIEEAVSLRNHGVSKPLLVLAGFSSAEELQITIENNLQSVIHSPGQLDIVEAQHHRVDCWVKVDTGMNRLGLSSVELPVVMDRIARDAKKRIRVEALMTHFACADDLASDVSKQQIQRFDQLTRGFDYPMSLANSGAIMSLEESHRQWIRPGIMLYGLSPFNDGRPDRRLKQVMTVTAPLLAVKKLRKGETVGYGATFQCERDALIGLVAAGYADGYPRWLPSGTPLRVCEQSVHLAGRVSMDILAVDLTTLAESGEARHLEPGLPVTLFGEKLPAETVASAGNTIAYVLTTGLTQRVKRLYNN